MIVSSQLPVFPICPSYGFTARPDYLVKLVTREGGHEKRDRKWEEPLHYYDGMPVGPRPQLDIERIARFWHAMGGNAQRFRFKDFAEFKSCYLDDEPDSLDQPLESLGGGQYRLVKQYTAETISTTTYQTTRTIYHPVGETVRIANDSGTEQADNLWTIDEDTGILTVEGGFSGTPASWGGEFYVPCRFDGELRVQIVELKIQSLECSIKELRPET